MASPVRIRFEEQFDEVRTGDRTFEGNRFGYEIEASPARGLNRIGINGAIGDEVDFDNARPGTGGTVNGFATIRPSDHVELRFKRQLSLARRRHGGWTQRRLFTALVARLRTQYTFSARTYVP